jgi:hypothetical protein
MVNQDGFRFVTLLAVGASRGPEGPRRTMRRFQRGSIEPKSGLALLVRSDALSWDESIVEGEPKVRTMLWSGRGAQYGAGDSGAAYLALKAEYPA